MKVYLITYRSITRAQQAEQVLSEAGFSCRLRRTMRWMEQRGCGYGTEVRLWDLEMGLRHLREKKIPWARVWLLDQAGEMKEVTP